MTDLTLYSATPSRGLANQWLLEELGVAYNLIAGQRIHNLLADDFIKGHSDIKGREVAHVLLSAIALA